LKGDIAKQVFSAFSRDAHRCHGHPTPHMMSRRQFARTAAGGALAAGVGLPGILRAQGKGASPPVPISGGSPAAGGFHVYAPGAFDPIDAEPITITDFNGFVGLAYVSGNVTRTDRTGAVRQLSMQFSDMRFMSGVYRGMDGRTHQGTFALV
jgi:hypothetical protein